MGSLDLVCGGVWWLRAVDEISIGFDGCSPLKEAMAMRLDFLEVLDLGVFPVKRWSSPTFVSLGGEVDVVL